MNLLEYTSVPIGTVVNISASEDALIGVFLNSTCVDEPFGGWQTSPTTLNATEPIVMSAIAYLQIPNENPVFSDCYVIEFTPPAPPYIHLNGEPSSVTAIVEESVSISQSDGAEMAIFYNLTCEGAPSSEWISGNTSNTTSIPQELSVMSRWPAYPAITSTCLQLIYVFPPPPAIMLNGITASLTAQVEEYVTISRSDGAEMGIFHNSTCAGDPSGGWIDGDTSNTTSIPQQLSVMSRWSDFPDITSPCLQLNYINSAAPTLTINGDPDAQHVEVGIDEQISISVESGATAYLFATQDCSGSSVDQIGSKSRTLSYDLPTSFSIQVRWDGQPEPTGPCRTIAWVGAEPEVPVVPQPSVTPTREPQATNTPTPAPQQSTTPTQEPVATTEPSQEPGIHPTATQSPEPTAAPTSGSQNPTQSPIEQPPTGVSDGKVTGLPDTGTGLGSSGLTVVAIFVGSVFTLLLGINRVRR